MYDRSEVTCHLCFKDNLLRTWIREESTERDICPWCANRGHLIALSKLAEAFRDVASLYAESDGPDVYERGELLSVLLDEDWQVFSEEIQVSDLAHELATSILYADLSGKERYDFPDYRGLFCRQDSCLGTAWDDRAYDVLKGEVPRPPDAATRGGQIGDEPPGQFEVAFEDMATLYRPEGNLYRARIHDDRRRTSRFANAEVGAPPPEKAKAGRANQAQQSVLYLASNKSTALAEVRPWKGAAVALADMTITRELMLVDLTRPQFVTSPFFVELLKWKVELANLLRRLGQDMSRPVMPHEQHVLYKPTQLLALLIQAAGYDGCIYPSAMGSGKNIVLFDRDAAEVTRVEYVRVKRTGFFSRPLSDHDDVYEEGPYDHALPEK